MAKSIPRVQHGFINYSYIPLVTRAPSGAPSK